MQCMRCSKLLPGSGVCSCGFDWRETAVSFVAPLSSAQILELLSTLNTKEGLELRACRGDLQAQVKLGIMYIEGDGVPKSELEAAKWFRLAAEQGDAFSQSWMGTFYRDGRGGIKQNHAEAAKWFRLAAEQGDSFSQSWLGNFYRDGKGVEQSYTEAARWYREAAEQGRAFAQCQLGKLYLDGKGVEQSDAEAAKWLRMGAEQGDAHAQSWMGTLYRDGRSGFEQNHVEAAKWFCLAAEQGDAYSQSELADFYRDGKGVEQDYAKAAKWYRKAAEQGRAYDRRQLGKLYRDGMGVAQSEAEAVKWFQMAAEQGDKYAKKWLEEMEQHKAEQERAVREELERLKQAARKKKEREEQIARKEDVRFRCSMADKYRDGKDGKQDFAEAIRWYRLALELDPDSTYAKYWLDVLDFMEKEGVQDLATANKICNLRSKIERERGEVYAMYQLGCQLIDPNNKKFCLEAEKWLQRAQDQGVEEARSKLKEVRKILSRM